LKLNKKARSTFDGLSNSHRKEYVKWLTEAKREATREQRLWHGSPRASLAIGNTSDLRGAESGDLLAKQNHYPCEQGQDAQEDRRDYEAGDRHDAYQNEVDCEEEHADVFGEVHKRF